MPAFFVPKDSPTNSLVYRLSSLAIVAGNIPGEMLGYERPPAAEEKREVVLYG